MIHRNTKPNNNLDLSFLVPGMPVYDGVAAGLAPRIIDFVSRIIDLIARLRK